MQEPPPFPQFPSPPTGPIVNDASAALASHLSTARAAVPPEQSTTGSNQRQTERERVAEEAIRSTIEHVVHEYVRQDLADRLGLPEQAAANGPQKLECHVGSPQHTVKVVILLFVSLVGVSTLLSTFSVTVLIGGSTLVYVSDTLGYQKGSILAMLLATGAFGSAVFVTNLSAISHFGPMCFLLNSLFGLLVVLVSAAIVHYKWMQATFPVLVNLLERISVGISPVVALPPLLSISIAFLSAKHAPLGFVLMMCVLHDQFYTRLRSSFLFERKIVKKSRSLEEAEDHGEDDEVLSPTVLTGRFEASLFTVLTLLLPSVSYLFLQSNWSVESRSLHLSNLLAVSGIPILYVFWNPRKSLWFLRPDTPQRSPSAEAQLQLDPLGLWEVVCRARATVLAIGYLFVLHWGVFRLLHSRFQYLFVGVPPPLNGLLLLLAAYALTGIIVLSKRVLDEDAKSSSATSDGTASAASPSSARATANKHRFAMDRVVILLLSVACALLVAAAAGMPQFFYPMSALTASSFNAYLLDRRNSSNFTLFCCCSSLLLMWWMYRTFSFIVMDLHVLGESATVPTPMVAVSVLWCYLMGCISFGLSFSENKRPFHIAMFLHSLKVAWIEHVLYSQNEAGSYPAIFVYLSSGLGVWLCMRLYKSGVMDITAASGISASYVAKLFTFLAEVSSAAHIGEAAADASRASNLRRSLEVALGWNAMMLLAFVVISTELEKRSGQVEMARVRTNVILTVVSAAVVAAATIENVQRSVSEFVLQRYLSREDSFHTALGTALITFALLTVPIFTRHRKAFAGSLGKLTDVCKMVGLVGVALFAVRPSQLVTPAHNSSVDFEIVNTDLGRIIALCGVGMAVAARFLPLLKVSIAIRAVYWLIATSLISVGITVLMIPAGNAAVVVSVGCFVFFSALTIDICHYRQLVSSEAWIVYGISVASMVITFIALGRVDLQKHAGANLLLIWEMHEIGRMTLLGVVASVNLFLAVLLKFRLEGKSLLPNSTPITTSEYVQQIGIIGNYSTLLTVVIFTILNLWAGGADPLIFVASGLILLLLIDDEMLFFELHKGANRYIPVLAYILAALWGTLLFDAYQAHWGKAHVAAILKSIAYALPVLPSHVSLLRFLMLGRSRGGARVSAVVAFVVVDLLCLLFASRTKLQWLALVGIAGQLCRLYEARFWRKSHNSVL